jgi:thioredoxin reductase/NAD-dependent dihydropyrimidine dehydrogenase PreA subunit
MDGPIIIVVAVVLLAVFVLPVLRRQRRLEQQVAEAEKEALARGLDEPITLSPFVDPSACIGTGNCVDACPEKDVLGLRFGQAVPVSPARCIGHGLCERSCPVEAISLVFGGQKRGVELPRIQENFETNVPGIYVIGELGGMGLIRNAFEQGRQCVEGIAAKGNRGQSDELDVVVVGCGPAGLSASINCQEHGLRFETLEREDIGGTVRSYPRKKLVMTQPLLVPGYGKLKFREIQKEELMSLWEEIVQNSGIQVRVGVSVERVERLAGGGFAVHSSGGVFRSRHVILAIGRRGTPRKLGVPGEDSGRVLYSLKEPSVYRGDRVLVVGGGDSAVEAALALADEPGTEVTLSYRRDAFRRIKDGNRTRIETAMEEGALRVLFNTQITEIRDQNVRYSDGSGGEVSLQNDHVFVFAGGILPTAFLEACGIQIDTKFGERL